MFASWPFLCPHFLCTKLICTHNLNYHLCADWANGSTCISDSSPELHKTTHSQCPLTVLKSGFMISPTLNEVQGHQDIIANSLSWPTQSLMTQLLPLTSLPSSHPHSSHLGLHMDHTHSLCSGYSLCTSHQFISLSWLIVFLINLSPHHSAVQCLSFNSFNMTPFTPRS